MSLAWRIEVAETAKKQLAKLDRQVQRDILGYLRERIAPDEDPRRYGAGLHKDLSGRWQYRVGTHRIICEIQDEKVVVVVLMVGHGSKLYGGHYDPAITQ